MFVVVVVVVVVLIYYSQQVIGSQIFLFLTDMGSITCKCNRLQLQLLWNFIISDFNYNYIFINVIDYNYRLHCKVIMITL